MLITLCKTHAEETKPLLYLLNKGFNNPMYGKTHTEETKLKIKMSILKTKDPTKHPMLGKHHSDETKKKEVDLS